VDGNEDEVVDALEGPSPGEMIAYKENPPAVTLTGILTDEPHAIVSGSWAVTTSTPPDSSSNIAKMQNIIVLGIDHVDASVVLLRRPEVSEAGTSCTLNNHIINGGSRLFRVSTIL
jgi:hypothetical protein